MMINGTVYNSNEYDAVPLVESPGIHRVNCPECAAVHYWCSRCYRAVCEHIFAAVETRLHRDRMLT